MQVIELMHHTIDRAKDSNPHCERIKRGFLGPSEWRELKHHLETMVHFDHPMLDKIFMESKLTYDGITWKPMKTPGCAVIVDSPTPHGWPSPPQ